MAPSHGICRVTAYGRWNCINCHTGGETQQPHSVASAANCLSPDQSHPYQEVHNKESCWNKQEKKRTVDSPKHKPCPKDENDPWQEQGNIDRVHRQEQRPAFPVVLLFKPCKHCPKDAEALHWRHTLWQQKWSGMIICRCALLFKQLHLPHIALTFQCVQVWWSVTWGQTTLRMLCLFVEWVWGDKASCCYTW